MNLRQKILLMFSLTVILAVAAVAWTVSLRVRSLFESLDRDRTSALVNQFLHEYQRRGDDVAQRVDRITKDERVARMAYDLAHGGDTSVYLTEAGTLAQEYGLDYLELVQPDGSIVSSAQWPAHFGYKEPALANAGQPAFLKDEVIGQDRSETGLFVARTVPGAESALDIVAGERLDSAFLSNLSTPAGSTVYLYRNATSGFSPSSLTGAGGGVADAVRYQEAIDRARTGGLQTHARVTSQDGSGGSLNLTAIPLKAADGSVIAVLLVASSREELVDAQQHIRAIAYGVAGVGILFAILVSLWIAARVSRPVEQLAQAARDVAAGDWDVRVPAGSNDEVGLLADSFNRMTTELISQRERLVQSERVAAWRELARRLAHELKNPLFPLQLTVENMIRAKQVSPEMFEEVFTEGVSALTDEIANLKTIIGRFSDFSKMPKPQPGNLDMRDVIARVVRLYQPTLEQREHPIEIASKLPTDPLPVSVDPELMHRAISNLVLNAMDAMPDGGTLTIASSRSGDNVRTTIADTGLGMTAEECERLFTPYYTTKHEGTGLGLAIVQSVIADHHGTIAVESNPGSGTVFVIDLQASGGERGGRA
jgi:two-component system, NtrC family, nitrogen regulation sensor histidine kinase NtrY